MGQTTLRTRGLPKTTHTAARRSTIAGCPDLQHEVNIGARRYEERAIKIRGILIYEMCFPKNRERYIITQPRLNASWRGPNPRLSHPLPRRAKTHPSQRHPPPSCKTIVPTISAGRVPFLNELFRFQSPLA